MNTTVVMTTVIWTLIVAGFGFLIGHAFSHESYHRRSASQEFRDQISRLGRDATMMDLRLKQVLDILNDIRTRVPAVSKGLENRPS